jgi:hypothetical protein
MDWQCPRRVYTDWDEVMHFNLKKAVGISVLPLLGGALAVGATALPASAQTFQDTALQAFNLTQPTTTTAAVVNGVASGTGMGSTLTFTAPSGEVFALVVFTTGTTDATKTVNATNTVIVLTSGGTKTGAGKLTFTIKSATSGVTCSANETVMVSESGGTLGESAAPTSTTPETVTVHVFNNNTTGAVEFSADVTPAGCGVTFSQSNLPPGLTSGNPLVPGSAVPRTDGNFYDGVRYTATDRLGSTFTGGTFDLHVFGHVVVPPPPSGNFGDEVNPFGNGFDVFQQHQAVNAIIAGWTATKADPATHFIRLTGTVTGAFVFEYAPRGIGTGLCVSDPGFDAAGTGLTNGLVLRRCNTGPWQQFVPRPNGTLKNVATGLIVSPNGTGAQLRGTTAPVSWGGSVYTWTDFAHLTG